MIITLLQANDQTNSPKNDSRDPERSQEKRLKDEPRKLDTKLYLRLRGIVRTEDPSDE
jgi:hypothetical protein